MSTGWQAGLIKLLRSHQPSSDAEFRNRSKQIIDDAVRQNAVSNQTAAKLISVRDLIEQWAETQRATDADFAKWREIYEAGDEIPVPIHQILISRFPKGLQATAWSEVLLRDNVGWLTPAVTRAKLVTVRDLISLAATSPEEVYLSAPADFLASSGKLPRAVLDVAISSRIRSSKLLTPGQLIVAHYAKQKGRKPFTPLLLGSAPESLLTEFATGVLADRKAGRKFATEMVDAHTVTKLRSEAAKLLERVLIVWQEGMSHSTAASASLIAAHIRSGLVLHDADEGDALPRFSVDAAFSAARAIEFGRPSIVMQACATLRAGEVHVIIQRFLQSLPTASEEDSASRLLRAESFRKVRELALVIIDTLEREACGDAARGAIEASLFNVGIERVDHVGDKVAFDPTRHLPLSAEMLPDENAEVVRPGWIWHETGDVLKKAEVQTVEA